MIPLVDLKKQYKSIKNDVNREVLKVLTDCNFILGNQVEEFEKAFAKFTGAKYCVGVGSGRDALVLAMRALGIGPEDEVITVANTFIATVFPIVELGAKPILVDIDPLTYQIDLVQLEKSITKKTKAIVPVHLFGIPNQMDKIMKIAKKYKLLVIEDACQGHGSTYKGQHVGTFGAAGAFSFYPGKNLGAAGEAGAIVTNQKSLYKKLRTMRDVGQVKKYHHGLFGYNSRLDTLQAAILSVKLKHLAEWNQKRRDAASLYRTLLTQLPITLPPEMAKDFVFNYHLFVIRTKHRDKLLEYLKKHEVGCGVHYPIPIHLQKALSSLGYKKGDFPITEKYAKEMLSLPIYAELKKSDIKHIASLMKNFFREL